MVSLHYQSPQVSTPMMGHPFQMKCQLALPNCLRQCVRSTCSGIHAPEMGRQKVPDGSAGCSLSQNKDWFTAASTTTDPRMDWCGYPACEDTQLHGKGLICCCLLSYLAHTVCIEYGKFCLHTCAILQTKKNL